jgi:hypothetical protein
MTTKREEAEEAMRYGPIVAKEKDRVTLLREAINEALEEAARVATRDRQHVPVAFDIAHDIRAMMKEAP